MALGIGQATGDNPLVIPTLPIMTPKVMIGRHSLLSSLFRSSEARLAGADCGGAAKVVKMATEDFVDALLAADDDCTLAQDLERSGADAHQGAGQAARGFPSVEKMEATVGEQGA